MKRFKVTLAAVAVVAFTTLAQAAGEIGGKYKVE